MKRIDDFTVVAAVMAQYVSYYLYSIGKARAICAAITLFYIFLLALRGAIRDKKPIDSFSIPNMIAFFVVTALFSIMAVKMYLRKPEEIK